MKKTITKLLVLTFLASSIVLSGCTDNSELYAQNEVLIKRLQLLEDSNAIQKLQSKYAHYLFTQDFDRIFSETMSQDSPDLSVEFSDSGVYRGQESVRALYAAFDRTKNIPGFFIMHITANPYIEIAEDGLTAKSHWLSPGATGNSNGAGWVWGPYYVDYIKENGEWKIWHTNLAALFRNRYEYSWADAPDHGSVRNSIGVEPDESTTVYQPYDELKLETDMFKNHPELPDPY